MVKVSPGDQWAWLMFDRPDLRCGQGVKYENLMGQDLDPGRGWKYRRLCSVSPQGEREFIHVLLSVSRIRRVYIPSF